MALIKSFVDSSKYDIKCPYAMSPVGVCIHNTANDAPAKNEVSYMKSNNNEVSFHVAVDDIESIQGIPFDRNAWAAGDGGRGNGNRNYIHIEICYSKSGGSRFIEAEKRAAKEIASILKSYGWGIDRVKKHQDFSGKYCPHRTLDMGYNRIIDMIKAELGSANPSNPAQPSNPSLPTGTYYRVVAGSYSVRANAEEMVKKLKGEGVSAFLLPVTANDGKNYLRVIAGSYKDRSNADKQMNELIAKGYNAFIAVYDENDQRVPSNPKPTPSPSISVGSRVNILNSASKYATGQSIPSEQKGSKVHTVQQISGEKALLKEIYSWVYIRDLAIAGNSSNVLSSGGDREIKRYAENGRCTVTVSDGIKFRDKPSTDTGVVQGAYGYRESVNYDLVVITEKYTWISWIGASSGQRRYMPIVDRKKNERWGTCV